ncbi:major facilitator superfamily (MFS) transporter [Acidisarcina polymorpha]|uniref:Major facilitator superfamily (MFS) transporter n=2 Tax=Acidisarcina polymorpha TaxID=2211140 RepID=A0A2Z5FTL4_9BACT|nr:major facilitator superfamily (MFS) transporter [Acidisarcina polymorpha]
MWLGACASTIGTFVQQFAQSWLVYDLTKDPFYLGLDLFLGQLPIILFSLVGGVFADRMDRRKMLLSSQYIQMACAFILTALFLAHKVQVWHILSLSFVVGLGQSFGGPAYSALLPTLVPAENLSNAIAMYSIQFNLARVLGPTLGGLAYATLGPTWCFALNGVSFLAVILSLMMIQVTFVPAKSKEAILKSMGAGIGFIRQREGLAALVFLAFSTTLLGFSLTGFLPVIVRTVFHGGPRTYQLLLVCSGAGSIVGALIVAASERLKGQGHVALLTLLALGTAISGFAVSRWLPLSCVLIFISGAAIMASASLMLSLVQLIVSEQMRGRVMSVYSLAFRAGIPLGSLALGKLIPIFGITAALGGSGILLIAVTLSFLVLMRSVATFQRPAETAR